MTSKQIDCIIKAFNFMEKSESYKDVNVAIDFMESIIAITDGNWTVRLSSKGKDIDIDQKLIDGANDCLKGLYMIRVIDNHYKGKQIDSLFVTPPDGFKEAMDAIERRKRRGW